MRISVIPTLALLVLVQTATARMLVREVTPDNAARFKWSVKQVRSGDTSTFRFHVPIKGAKLPEGTSATLEVKDGKKLVSRATLQPRPDGDGTVFEFTVSNRYLAHSKFTLTVIDVPHPAGDIYWSRLQAFAKR